MNKRIETLANMAIKQEIFPPQTAVRYCDFSSYSKPMQISKCIGEYLMNQRTGFIDGELLGGFFKFDGSVTSCAYFKAGHTHDVAFFTKHSDYQPESNPVCFLDWDHYCANFPFVVNHGIVGYLKRIEKAKENYKDNEDKQEFLKALENTCKVIEQYSNKVADDYEQRGLLQIAQNCRKVPYYPAETFYEAVQSVWFTWLFLSDSLGRLDQILYPFYKRDLENHRIDRETAYELVCELLIKVFAQHGYKEHRSGDNTLSVGGYTLEEEDGFNEVSKMILEALVDLPTWRPQVSFRYTSKTPFETLKYITEMNMNQKNIALTNDEPRITAYEKLGITHKDAINYTMIGCNEWTIMGKGHTGSQGFFNPLISFNELLIKHTEELEKLSTFEQFYSCYTEYLKKDVLKMMDLADAYFDEESKDINVLTSVLVDDCIEKATSITAGGAEYSASNWSCNGFANLVDSLSVVKYFVYEWKKFSLPELSEMIKKNWTGFEDIRLQILKSGIFWGNDNPADDIAAMVVSTLHTLSKMRTPKKGGAFRFGAYIGYNLSNVTMGRQTKATPDGRYDGDYFASAMSAGVGKDVSGVTAYLKSVAKIDFTTFIGPLAVNLKFDKNILNADEKVKKLAHLYETYFKLGGLQLQPDYVSAEDLIKAQENPEYYKNLRVRVTGYSGLFTLLDKELQNEIIHRTEHQL